MNPKTYFIILFLNFTTILVNSRNELIRFSLSKPSHSKSSIFQRLLSDSVDLPLHDFDFVPNVGTVQLGSNNEIFNLIFDTGYSWIWLPSDDSKGHAHKKFSCSSSTTCNSTSNKIEIPDKSWSLARDVEGFLVYETITIAKNLTLENHPLILAKDYDEFGLMQYEIDGYLGLGLNFTFNGYPSIIDVLFDNEKIPAKQFSLYMDPNSTNNNLKDQSQNNNNQNSGSPVKQDSLSELILGGYDPKYMKNDFIYLNLTREDAWSIDIDQVLVPDQPLKIISDKIIFVSGTKSLHMPTQDYEEFLSLLSKVYNISFSGTLFGCNDIDINSLPNLVIKSQGLEFTINSLTYVEVFLPWCRLGITDEKQLPNTWILGEVFFKNYYTLFDIENKRIGLAEPALLEKPQIQLSITWALFFNVFPLAVFGLIVLSFIYKFMYEDLSPKIGNSGLGDFDGLAMTNMQ